MNDNTKAIAVEKMAKEIYKQFIDKFNYVPPCGYENATLDGLPFLDIAQCLVELGYRKQSDTVKEFAKKLNALLDVPFDGKPAQKQVRKGMEEGLKMAIEIAAEFGVEGQH